MQSFDLRLEQRSVRLWDRHRLWLRRPQRRGWAGTRSRELNAALHKLRIPLEEAVGVRGVLGSWRPNWAACALSVAVGWVTMWAMRQVSTALAEAGGAPAGGALMTAQAGPHMIPLLGAS